MNARAILNVALLCLSAAPAHAEGRLWTYKAGEVLQTFRQSPLGNVIVTTPSRIIALDAETGQAQWERSDFLASEIGLTFLPMAPAAIAETKQGLAVIDLDTGKTRWDTSSLALKSVSGFLPVPELAGVLVFGSTGERDNVVMLADFASGEKRWENGAVLDQKPRTECRNPFNADIYDCGTLGGQLSTMTRHQFPIVHDDGIVFFVSKDGLVKVDAATGEVRWKVQALRGQQPPMRAQGYAPFVVRDDVVYVPYGRKLMAVDMRNGTVLWNHDKQFKAPIRQMEMSSEGLVVRGFAVGPELQTEVSFSSHPVGSGAGGEGREGHARTSADEQRQGTRSYYLDVISADNGVSSWKRPLTNLDCDLSFFVDEDYAFVPRRKDVLLVDLQQGQYNQFATLELQGKEVPDRVERVGKDYLVTSSQNMVLLKSRGGMRYQKYYKAPGTTFGQKVLFLAGGIVLDDIFKSDDMEHRWSRWGPDGSGTFEVGAMPFSMASVEMCGERFKQSVDGNRLRYVCTGEPLGDRKGYSLVKVDKATGQEVGRIWVDKQIPEYTIDLATETVFARDGLSSIFAVR